MDKWLEMVPQVPAAAAVITVVVLFLRHLSEERKADREAAALTTASMESIANTCHASARELADRFQEQISLLEDRAEKRRMESEERYERDRREMSATLTTLSSALNSNAAVLGTNGETLRDIKQALTASGKGG